MIKWYPSYKSVLLLMGKKSGLLFYFGTNVFIHYSYFLLVNLKTITSKFRREGWFFLWLSLGVLASLNSCAELKMPFTFQLVYNFPCSGKNMYCVSGTWWRWDQEKPFHFCEAFLCVLQQGSASLLCHFSIEESPIECHLGHIVILVLSGSDWGQETSIPTQHETAIN